MSASKLKNAYRRNHTSKPNDKPRVRNPGAPSLKAFAKDHALGASWLKNKRRPNKT